MMFSSTLASTKGKIASKGIVNSTNNFTYAGADTNYHDVTNPATLTLTGLVAAKTYTIFAVGQFNFSISGGCTYGFLRLNIGGTAQGSAEQDIATNSNTAGCCLVGYKSGCTGATTYDIKAEIANGNGVGSVNLQGTGGGAKNSIVAWAVEE